MIAAAAPTSPRSTASTQGAAAAERMAWLDRYDLRWDLLVMRARGDYSQVTWYKRDSVDELRHFGFDLRLAFEDDPNNFAMFHAMGIPCVYIHSGYYE